MSIICPNLKNPDVAREFEELKNATSEAAAYHIWSLNNGNSIDKAPNGAESILFQSLLRHYGENRSQAIRAKAKAYSTSFLSEFGDWISEEKPEPTLEDIQDRIVDTAVSELETERGFQSAFEVAEEIERERRNYVDPIVEEYKNSSRLEGQELEDAVARIRDKTSKQFTIRQLEKLNALDGITDQTKNIIKAALLYDDMTQYTDSESIYDRAVGNYDSSRYLSSEDKRIFQNIKEGTSVRLKSQLSRTIKNTSLITDLKHRLDIIEGRDEDSIDDVFDTIEEFLLKAEDEILTTKRFIDRLIGTDMSTWDPQQINFIRQDLIGYYDGLLSDVYSLFVGASPISQFNKMRVDSGDQLNLENLSRQLRSELGALQTIYQKNIVMPYAKKVLVDFVNESDAVKDKPAFIQNMLTWLDQDTKYGDLQAGEIVWGLASRSRSPIVRIIEKMMSDVEFERDRLILKTGTELVRVYNKIRPVGSQISFSNFQKLFVELDGEDGTTGLPTGYFPRDRNYGKFWKEKDEYEDQLRKEFASEGVTWRIGKNNLVETIFPEEDYLADNSVYNRYYDKLDIWLDQHCERRYTLEYYKQRRRFLSPAAIQAKDAIQREIDLLCQNAVTDLGFIDENLLLPQQRTQLRILTKQKQELASPYLFTTDSNGTVVLEEKVGESAEIAEQIRKWNKFISDKVKYKQNDEKFNQALRQMKEKYGTDSVEVKRFIRSNLLTKINPEFWEELSKVRIPVEQTEEFEDLKARRRFIIEHIKERDGYYQQDLTKLGTGLYTNDSTWKELQRIDQRMSEITNSLPEGEKDESYQYITSMLVDSPVSREPFINFLRQQWAPAISANPSLEETFNSLFTFVDKKGARRLLSAFSYITPAATKVTINDKEIDTIIKSYSSEYYEIDENSEYVNPNFDKTLKESLQPKIRKPGTARKSGTIDYTNENYKKIQENAGYKQFYDLILKTMDDANSRIPQKGGRRDYLMPQITGRGFSILGRTCTSLNMFKAIKYGAQDFFGVKFSEQDADVSTNWDLPRRPDGTVVNNIPIRFIKRLECPWLISTDVLGSVMLYYDMALNYDLKSKNLPTLELLEQSLDPAESTSTKKLSKQYEKVQNLLNFRYYGKEDRNYADEKSNKISQATTTMGKRFRRLSSYAMLGLNFTTIQVGYIDAFLSAIADAVGGKYMTKKDLAYGYWQTLKNLGPMLLNLGNQTTDNWMVAAMQYNQLSKSNAEIFGKSDQSRFSRLLDKTLMGGYTMADYCINTMVLGATYHHYRLVEMPDHSGKKFMSKNDAIAEYTKFGYSEKEAIKKYNSSKTTLKEAYTVVNGYLTVKDKYRPYVTKKLENQIAGRLRDRTAVYNGVIPATEKAKIQQNVWGSYVTLMRNFYVNTYWERAGVGFDYVDPNLTDGKYKAMFSDSAGYVNFETGETGNGLWFSFLKGLYNLVSNAINLVRGKDLRQITNDQKYAMKRIFADLAILYLCLQSALWSIAFARKHDYDDTTPTWTVNVIGDGPFLDINTNNYFDKLMNWGRWKLALVAERSFTERVTFYWPGTINELINSPSTATTFLENIGYTIDLAMGLFSINGEDNREIINRGAYKGMTKGTRNALKLFSPLGVNNLVRGWHTSGIKSTLNYYRNVSPNKYLIPSQKKWEEDEGYTRSTSYGGSYGGYDLAY